MRHHDAVRLGILVVGVGFLFGCSLFSGRAMVDELVNGINVFIAAAEQELTLVDSVVTDTYDISEANPNDASEVVTTTWECTTESYSASENPEEFMMFIPNDLSNCA